MIYARPQCYDCKHRRHERGPLSCDAFPAGVPDAIKLGSHDHREPFPGDNGILFFEPLPATRKRQTPTPQGK
jgi:hypothetical protein